MEQRYVNLVHPQKILFRIMWSQYGRSSAEDSLQFMRSH